MGEQSIHLLMAYWRGWDAFECLKPTGPTRGTIGLSLFIFLFISCECTFWFIRPYDSSHCEEYPYTQHWGSSSWAWEIVSMNMYYWHRVNIDRRSLRNRCKWHHLSSFLAFSTLYKQLRYGWFYTERKKMCFRCSEILTYAYQLDLHLVKAIRGQQRILV